MTLWPAVRTADGSWTLAHPTHGETCHSRAGAWQQARERYAAGCRLRERALALAAPSDAEPSSAERSDAEVSSAPLSAAEPRAGQLDSRGEARRAPRAGAAVEAAPLEAQDPGRTSSLSRSSTEDGASGARGSARVLRVLDVGTGLGLNLCAALAALEGTRVALEAVSLECDRDVLARTLELARAGAFDEPPDLARAHRRVRVLFEQALARPCGGIGDGALEHGNLGDGDRGMVVLGDARASIEQLPTALRFDAIFLDPFSPRVDGALWSRAFLRALANRLAPTGILATYSSAVEVRVGLLAAGLSIGLGAPVGTKSSGTLAGQHSFLPPLPARLARRLEARARQPLRA